MLETSKLECLVLLYRMALRCIYNALTIHTAPLKLYFGPLGLPRIAPRISDCFEPAFPFVDMFENLAILVRNFVIHCRIYVQFQMTNSRGGKAILTKFLQQPHTKYD
jgi:hypothetical protein